MCYGLVYLGFALAPGAWMWSLFVIYGAYIGLTEGVEEALVTALAPQELRTTLIGLHATVIGIGLLPAPAIAGLLWRLVGSSAPFIFGGSARHNLGAACAGTAPGCNELMGYSVATQAGQRIIRWPVPYTTELLVLASDVGRELIDVVTAELVDGRRHAAVGRPADRARSNIHAAREIGLLQDRHRCARQDVVRSRTRYRRARQIALRVLHRLCRIRAIGKREPLCARSNVLNLYAAVDPGVIRHQERQLHDVAHQRWIDRFVGRTAELPNWLTIASSGWLAVIVIEPT